MRWDLRAAGPPRRGDHLEDLFVTWPKHDDYSDVKLGAPPRPPRQTPPEDDRSRGPPTAAKKKTR